MNYTRILFAALLLPVSGYGNTERIKQLKEEQLKKSLKLKTLAKQISDADNYIHTCKENYSEYLYSGLNKRKEALEEAFFDEKSVEQEMKARNIAIVNDLEAAIIDGEPFNYELTRDLYDDPDDIRVDALDSLKFMFVRMVTEWNLITLLVPRYEACLHELIEINKELKELIVVNQQLLALEQYGN